MGDEAEHGGKEQQAAVGENGNNGACPARTDARAASRAAEERGHDGGKSGSHERVSGKTCGGQRREKRQQHAGKRQQRAAEQQNEVAQHVPQAIAEKTAAYGGDGKGREHEGGGVFVCALDGEEQQTSPFGHGAFRGVGEHGENAAKKHEERQRAGVVLAPLAGNGQIVQQTGGGLSEKAGVETEHAGGVDERIQAETGEHGPGDGAGNAAEAVGGVHERHARCAVAMFRADALGVHGYVHEAHACAHDQTACAELERRLGQTAQRRGGRKRHGAVFEKIPASPEGDEAAAAEQSNEAGHADAEQQKTYLGLVGAGLHFQRGQAGSEHAIGESGAEKEVRAGRAGDGKLSPFHAKILDFFPRQRESASFLRSFVSVNYWVTQGSRRKAWEEKVF